MSAFRHSAWHAHGVHVDQPHFRVTYTAPSGSYEMTGKATSEVEAVRLADETLEYVERVGIRDHMRDDGQRWTRPLNCRSTASSPMMRHPVSAS